MVICLMVIACHHDDANEENQVSVDYKEEMRNFVIGISQYTKASYSAFKIIPQNGIELVTSNGESDGPMHDAYMSATDGHGQEDLFYGYDSDNVATKQETNKYLRSFLDRAKGSGNTILVTDYCSTSSKMDDAYAKNAAAGYTSFAADHRELDHIPAYPAVIPSKNSNNISALGEVKNFLYLINLENYSSKAAFIDAVTSTDYDLLITDLFFNDGSAFTKEEVESLKMKSNGGKRLVVAYMSIGEAEDYRYYWKNEWSNKKPDWLDKVNPDWPGNFKVKYWNKTWQDIIYGNDDSYAKKILDAGFDGAYLDIIDAFEYYEK